MKHFQTDHPTKRLIEVDLSIRRISEHARGEINSARAYLHAAHLVGEAAAGGMSGGAVRRARTDPVDEHCPESFREAARGWMQKWTTQYTHLLSGKSQQRFFELQKDPKKLDDDETLRDALLDFITDFANWDNSTVFKNSIVMINANIH
jgi:hypothetical protein